jgi:hypothetical protein
MEYRTRKCSQLVNLTNFDCRHDVRLTHNVGLTQGFQPTRYIKLALIQAYGAWVQEQMDEGWDGTYYPYGEIRDGIWDERVEKTNILHG